MVTVLQELTVNLGVTIWAYERITEQSSMKWKDSACNGNSEDSGTSVGCGNSGKNQRRWKLGLGREGQESSEYKEEPSSGSGRHGGLLRLSEEDGEL